ncbi:MAG: IS21 family transposase [Actinomycetota bacterium]
MIDVHEWAEIRQLHLSEGLSIKAIARRLDVARNTVRTALRSAEPPTYRRPQVTSKLDPFKGKILSLLDHDSEIPGKRVLEILQDQGYRGGKSILNEHLREVRPLFRRARTYQRTTYIPGQIAQWDLWEPEVRIPVGFGHLRRGYVVTGALGYSRVGCGTLVFNKAAPDLLWALDRGLGRIGAVPRTNVFDREGALCLDKTARDPRPTEPLARYAGALGFAVHFRPKADPEGKGVVERLNGYLETSFLPGRSFRDPEDFQSQLDGWFDTVANVRFHRMIRCRPLDRLGEDLGGMLTLPARRPEISLRFHVPVRPDPYVRVDTCDYSVHPVAVGRVVEVRVTQRDVVAVTKDGQVVARHPRSFAPHRTITAAEHGRAIRELREPGAERLEPAVEVRDLASYDRALGLEAGELAAPFPRSLPETGSERVSGPSFLQEGAR